MTTFCNIANPSEMSETDKTFRIKKTSASGHTRIRPVGRQTKKEFTLNWLAMSAADKATLQAFHTTNFALEFDWTQPCTNIVYTVFFYDEDITFKYVEGSNDRWAVGLTLGEV